MDEENNYHAMTVSLIGDENVGKTAIVNMCLTGQFSEEYSPTTTIEPQNVEVEYDGKKVRITLYDFGMGQQNINKFPNILNQSDVILIVFDLTNPTSFDNISNYQRLINSKPIFVVANKKDLPRKVSEDQIQQFNADSNSEVFECSAKDNRSIEDLFSHVVLSFSLEEALSRTVQLPPDFANQIIFPPNPIKDSHEGEGNDEADGEADDDSTHDPFDIIVEGTNPETPNKQTDEKDNDESKRTHSCCSIM